MKQTYTFRFDNNTHAALKAKAISEGVTISAYLEAIVKIALGDHEPKCWNPETAISPAIPAQIVTPATVDEVLDQVVEDMPALSSEI